MGYLLIDGNQVGSELDLHRVFERELEFGDHYGRNLAALRDRLLTDIPRPIRLVWTNADVSREKLGEELFAGVIAIFEEVSRQDVSFGWEDRFEFELS